MKMSCGFTGYKQFIKELQKLGPEVVNAAVDSSEEFAQELMRESVQQVPVDTGALAASAFVRREGTSLAFGYGGDAVQWNDKSNNFTDEYMTAVHERVDIKHTSGNAKFFENPYRAAVAVMDEILAAKIRRKVKKL